MTTEEYLSSKNVTIELARNFLLNNYESNIETIFNTCKQYGINNDMIADILQNDFAGLTGQGIANFFTNSGFDGNTLGFNAEENKISYSLKNGLLTNTGSSDIIITDIGMDINGSANFYGQNISFTMEGTIEQGFTVNSYGTNEFVPGYIFPDETISTNESFNLNDFLPDNAYEDIPNASGNMNMEITLITTTGTYTDETTMFF